MDSEELIINLKLIPPTTNTIYITLRNGRRVLSANARNFITLVKQEIMKMDLVKVNPKSCLTFKLELRLFWDKIFTKSYPKCDSPYQKIDTDNRIKIIKDTIKECLSLEDDSQVFCDEIKKIAVDNEEKEGTTIKIKEVDPSNYIEIQDINLKNKILENCTKYKT